MKNFLLGATVAAAAVLAVTAPAKAQLAFGQTVTITQNGLPNGEEDVTMTTPNWNGGSEAVRAGQQQLIVTAVNGNPVTPFDVYVWCVDFGQTINVGQGGYNFSVTQFSTITGGND